MHLKKCSFLILFVLCGCASTSHEEVSLMIVAHPDDESIFGGNHIIKEKYFILCLTNGNNKVRKKEFEEMLNTSKNEGVILSFPDKINGKRDTWENKKKEIYNIIKYYINKKEWKRIVTHNANGEYGHIHHRMIHYLVTNACKAQFKTNRLYYFGNYYKKEKQRLQNEKWLYKDELKKKEFLISIYQSQVNARNKLQHSYPYENWVKYK